MMGAWGGRAAHMGDDNPAVASQACASFRKNPKHVLGDVLVFKANRKFSYGGYADYVDTNVSVKRLAPNTWLVVDRHYHDGEGGGRPGYRNVRYQVSVVGDILIITEGQRTSRFGRCVAEAPPKRCLQKGDEIEGTLQIVRTKTESGKIFEVFQLVSMKPYCVRDNDFCPEGRTATRFHIIPTDDNMQKKLQLLVGSELKVKADDFFCPHTQWHIGDAIAHRVTIWSKQ
jgi:hypothetical protein